MIVPLSWLREHVEVDLDPAELARRLTMAGIEVEAIHATGALHPAVVVGAVVSVEPIPKNDKLCHVVLDVGRTVHAVSGAPNLAAAAPGTRVATALPGAVVFDAAHGGTRARAVAERRIAGVDSAAVTCSALELGIGDDHRGVLLLDAGAAPGTPLASLLPRGEAWLADQALEIAILPNIARCLSITGVAREVAAVTGARLRPEPPLYDLAFSSSDLDPYTDVPELCDQFAAALVEGIVIRPSPPHVQRRLIACGLEPINNVVDASNFTMLELGQPTHAYDADRLPSLRLGVRRARAGDVLKALTDAEDAPPSPVPEGVLLIVSDDQPVAIAGIVGGFDSRVTEETGRLLIESAHFDMIAVRRGQTATKLRTEASARFSRGVDPALPERGVRRLLEVLSETCPDLRVARTGRWSAAAPPERRIRLRVAEINRALGTDVAGETAVELLERAGLRASHQARSGELEVVADSSREDVALPCDVMEEIARLHGYDRMASTMPADPIPDHPFDRALAGRAAVVDCLVALGLQEVVNYTLSSPEAEAALLAGRTAPAEPPPFVELQNPLSRQRSVMRRSLLPGLLDTVQYNRRHAAGCHVFEIGPVMLPKEGSPGELLPAEPLRLGIAMSGAAEDDLPGRKDLREADFADLGAVVHGLLGHLHIAGARLVADDVPPFHPGICARVIRGERCYGHLGAVHASVAEAFGLTGRSVLCAELFLDDLVADWQRFFPAAAPPRFPSIELDVALTVPETVPAGDLVDAARAAGGALVRAAAVFDVYRGEQAGPGRKGIGLRFALGADDRTLRMEEAKELRQRVVDALGRRFGAVLRV